MLKSTIYILNIVVKHTAIDVNICGIAMNLLFASMRCVSRSPKFSVIRVIEAAERQVLEPPVSDCNNEYY